MTDEETWKWIMGKCEEYRCINYRQPRGVTLNHGDLVRMIRFISGILQPPSEIHPVYKAGFLGQTKDGLKIFGDHQCVKPGTVAIW